MKTKICKGCNRVIRHPINSLQKVHNYTCFTFWQKRTKKVKLTKLKEQYKDYKKLAWKEFSKYIRFKNLINGMATCYTCKKPVNPKEANAGHFHHNKLDYDEDNVRVQCIQCNKHLHGNLSVYRANLLEDYGQQFLDDLELKSNKCEPIPQWKHKEIYEKYKKLNSQ